MLKPPNDDERPCTSPDIACDWSMRDQMIHHKQHPRPDDNKTYRS